MTNTNDTNDNVIVNHNSLAEHCTDDHLTYMEGVDLVWAEQYIKYAQRMQHFLRSVNIFWVTPRVVRIAVLRPESIVRLFRNRHAVESRTHLGEVESFEQSKWYVNHEEWNKPVKTALPKDELSSAVEGFRDGMTPMEALQFYHANAEDGDENEDLPPFSPPLMETFLVLALIAMIIFGALSWYSTAKEAAEIKMPTVSELHSVK